MASPRQRSWQSLSDDEQYALFDLSLQDSETDSQALDRAFGSLLNQSSLQVPNPNWSPVFPSHQARQESTSRFSPNQSSAAFSSSSTSRPAGANFTCLLASSRSNPFNSLPTGHPMSDWTPYDSNPDGHPNPFNDPPVSESSSGTSWSGTPNFTPVSDPTVHWAPSDSNLRSDLSSTEDSPTGDPPLPSALYSTGAGTFLERTFDPPEPTFTAPYVPLTDDPLLIVAMSVPDFIPDEPTGASIKVMTASEQPLTIHNVSLETIEEACPLLAAGFEETRGVWKCILEAKSRLLAVSLLRFLYTKSYLIKDKEPGGREIVHPSLLFHVLMYQLAYTFDVPALNRQARINIVRVTESSCSTPYPIQDLCAAIALVYDDLPRERELKTIMQHYIVSCFDYHKLKDDMDFCALIRDFPDFGIDLCKMNVEHNFRDKGAADIIQLPIPAKPKNSKLTQAEHEALLNFVYEMWGPEMFTARTGYETGTDTGTDTESSTASIRRTFTLVRRPKAPGKNPIVDDSESETSMSEAEGFALVKRPKQSEATSLPPLATPAASDSPSETLPSEDSESLFMMDATDDDDAADNEDSDNDSVQSDFTIVG